MSVVLNNSYVLDYHIGADFVIRALGVEHDALFHEFATIFKSRNLKV